MGIERFGCLDQGIVLVKGLDQFCCSQDVSQSYTVTVGVSSITKTTGEGNIGGFEGLDEVRRGRVVHEVGHRDDCAIQQRHSCSCIEEVVVLDVVQDLADGLVLDAFEGYLVQDDVELC